MIGYRSQAGLCIHGMWSGIGVRTSICFQESCSEFSALRLGQLTNRHFTLKTNPLRREDLDEFVRLYQPANRHDRAPTWSESTPDGRWRVYDYNALVARDKASLNIFWLKDDSLANSDNLPAPDVIAQEVVDDLEAALEQFRLIAGDIGAFDTAAS